VYQAGSVLASRLTWVDRAGKQVGVIGEDAEWYDVQLSPDGTRAAVSARAASHRARGLWIFNLTRDLKTRFTLDDVDEISPVWSPIDDRIIFGSNRNKGRHDLSSRVWNTTGKEDSVLADAADKLPDSWSPDGRFILYDVEGQNQDLWVLPLFGDGKPFPFANTQFVDGFGSFSPDGRWIAYLSGESGQLNVYVAPFPGPGGKIRISPAGALTGNPRWRRDGKELFYLAPDGQLMAAEVNATGTSVGVTDVRPLFNSHARLAPGNKFDASGDGQRFLINTSLESTTPTAITLVVNWMAGLKK
jgi:Tol biopolymer transport system component